MQLKLIRVSILSGEFQNSWFGLSVEAGVNVSAGELFFAGGAGILLGPIGFFAQAGYDLEQGLLLNSHLIIDVRKRISLSLRFGFSPYYFNDDDSYYYSGWGWEYYGRSEYDHFYVGLGLGFRL